MLVVSSKKGDDKKFQVVVLTFDEDGDQIPKIANFEDLGVLQITDQTIRFNQGIIYMYATTDKSIKQYSMNVEQPTKLVKNDVKFPDSNLDSNVRVWSY